MMNIHNQGLKESLGVKFNNSIWSELRWKLWFDSDCISVILLSQDGVESECPETEFQTITSEN